MLKQNDLIAFKNKIILQGVLNDNLDFQGISYDTFPRQTYLQHYRKNIHQQFGVLQVPPIYPPITISTDVPLVVFEQFTQTYTVDILHQQLTNCLIAISERFALVAGEKGIYLVNLETKQSKLILAYRSFCIDYDMKSELLCGTNTASEADKTYFIYSSRENKILYEGTFYDTDLINSVKFIDSFQKDLLICGNEPRTVLLDLEKLQPRVILPTLTNVNAGDFSHKKNIFAFAMDATEIQLSDPRLPETVVANLIGHKDFNFAVCFFGQHQLASGGQDCSVRVWDMRNYKSPCDILPLNERAVGSILYNNLTECLYVNETLECLNTFQMCKGKWLHHVFRGIGMPKGISFIPGHRKMLMSIFDFNAPGIFRFNLVNADFNDN